MDKVEYINFKEKLFEDSADLHGVRNEERFLNGVIPDLLTVKLIDTDDINFIYYNDICDKDQLKLNGYCINQTGERLLLFIVDEHSLLTPNLKEEDIFIGSIKYYQNLFNRSLNFVKKSINRSLEVNDSDNSSYLIHQFGQVDFIDNLETIEIFLVSPTIPIESKSNEFKLKRHKFQDEIISTKINTVDYKKKKEILIVKQLISLDKMHNYAMSDNATEPVIVDVENDLGVNLEVLKAADEKNFESYLCVLPGEGVAKLYGRYSTRLLERNVRSFLQFKGVNAGMKKTIANHPERFIAYNNGLTITATDCIIKSNGGKLILKELTDFQIVNGGQTTASLFFAKKGTKNSLSLDVSRVNVMAKINIVKNVSEEELSELVENISLYSNSQTKVSNVDKRVSNPKIASIKALSESIIAPNNDKWYFEKMKGEFKTMLLFKGWDKKTGDKEYPKERRLTKTEVGKYYTAWGDQPWLVKKGGEMVFGTFISSVSNDKNGIEINREFYEELIAKSILFRSLEKTHGTRGKAIGQLRAAVVPYTLSTLFKLFGGSDKKDSSFNLGKIWKKQGLSDSLTSFCESIMAQMYVLINKYKTSDDVSENTKKEELWESIKKSSEFKDILASTDARTIKDEYARSVKKSKKYHEVDFSQIRQMSNFYSIGSKELYRTFKVLEGELSDTEIRKINKYLTLLFSNKNAPNDIGNEGVLALERLVNLAYKKGYQFKVNSKEKLNDPNLALDNIMLEFSRCIDNQLDIESEFKKHESIASHKKMKYTSVINTMGGKIKKGTSPSFKELFQVSAYFSSINTSVKKKQ